MMTNLHCSSLASTSRLELQVSGPSDYDNITLSTAELGGVLAWENRNGYTPLPGSFFQPIVSPTGGLSGSMTLVGQAADLLVLLCGVGC